MAELGRIAERHPGLKLHIDHHGRGGGGGSGKDDAAFANLGEMLALAKLPNVAVKLSGAPSYSSEPYPTATSTNTFARSLTCSVRSALSGALTSPVCRARIGSA